MAMKQHSWPFVFAYLGLAIIGFVLANFSTAVATGGIAAGNLGRGEAGRDMITAGSAMLMVGVAMMAVFGYLALTVGLSMVRARRTGMPRPTRTTQ